MYKKEPVDKIPLSKDNYNFANYIQECFMTLYESD